MGNRAVFAEGSSTSRARAENRFAMPTSALCRRELLDRASRRAAALALGSLFGATRGQGDAIAARRNATVPRGAYP